MYAQMGWGLPRVLMFEVLHLQARDQALVG
jgi:hypothetical protein